MSAYFEKCPVGTMAKLRRVEEAAAKVIKRWDSPLWRVHTSTAELIHELRDATGYADDIARDEAERMRDVMEDR
jgi:hypothetical protein